MTTRLDPLTLPLWGSRLIEASAGTGKTWTIATLYLRLVLGHGEAGSAFGGPLAPSQVLVMTFTIAATRELSDRIRDRLVDAARCFRDAEIIGPDDAVMRQLVDAYPAGSAREGAAWRLAMAAEGMDDAAVFTIDAWVQRMLREHAFDSGSLFDEELQPDDESLLTEVARDYWRREVYPMSGAAFDAVLSVWCNVKKLTDDMRVLVRHLPTDDGPVRSLAAVLDDANERRRTALADLKSGWSARADAMRRWLHSQLPANAKQWNGSRLQRKRTDGWLDALEAWAGDPDRTTFPLTPAAVFRLSPEGLRDAAATGCSPEAPTHCAGLQRVVDALQRLSVPAHAMRRHAAARVSERLQMQKRRAGAWGFDDMLRRLDSALAGPSGGRLRERIVAQYPVALIDEFQDTSPVQYRIFDRLYRTADNHRESALLLIGDPKQSIYGFRGADIHSYLRARTATAGRHYFLTTNHRSTAGLVDAINHLFAQAEPRGAGAFRFGGGDPKTGESPLPFFPVGAKGRPEVYRTSAGPVAAMTLCHDTELSSKADAQRRFAERCAEHVATTLNDVAAGFVDPAGAFTRLKPADITVLVRDRFEAAAVRRALQKRRVASVFLSDQDSVFRSAEARDVLQWLRAVADPLDSRQARVAFATSLIGLPLGRLARLGNDDQDFEARVDELKRLNGEWRRQGVLPMLRRTLHLLDLPALWLAEPDGERKLTNVLHLAELLQTASTHLDGEHALIRWLADQLCFEGQCADEQIVRLESDADLVRVVTIHKAKGLEYPVVYLPFVASFRWRKWEAGEVAVLPGADGERTVCFDVDDEVRRRADLESQREDVRLLYVALTRARHALWLGVAPLKDGGTDKCGFHRSAFGYLVSGEAVVAHDAIAARLGDVFGTLASVRRVAIDGAPDVTHLRPPAAVADLLDAPVYDATFERDWSIGSFSSFVRDLPRVPSVAAMVDPAVEEELLSTPVEPAAGVSSALSSPLPSNAARHRFPRGALPGNFLHDQLEWLAGQRFALATDRTVRDQLARRCERQGWGHRASDVVRWLGEVVGTVLPPIGVALDGIPRILPEMEFWFPSEGIAARQIDRLCRRHLLGGRDRPALPDRSLSGMLMGFADLVFEVDGRYWVLDYKSNALGPGDDDYTADALEAAMAEHRYDVQAMVYLLALHRLLRQRLGARYDPARHLGGALYLFLRGIEGPAAGCYVIEPAATLLEALDDTFAGAAVRP